LKYPCADEIETPQKIIYARGSEPGSIYPSCENGNTN
jgi:hypothetical protein